MTCLEYRESVHADVSERVRAFSEIAKPAPGVGVCLPAAVFTVGRLMEDGCGAMLQAGSMNWPLVAAGEADDGGHTHFAYQWDPGHPLSRAARLVGRLPEIHVWAAIEYPARELVDMSTYAFRECAEAGGLRWRSSDPPSYLWVPEGCTLPGVYYEANAEAMFFLFNWLGKRQDFVSAVAAIHPGTAMWLREFLNNFERITGTGICAGLS